MDGRNRMYKELQACIICNSDLTEVVNLGQQYVVDFVKAKDEKLLKAPLVLMKCNKCSFIQLKHRVSPDRLYKKFWYRSGINEQMRDELCTIVQKAQKVVELKDGDKVLDIGANDGTLLGWYPQTIITVGVDPCEELVVQGVKEKRIDLAVFDYFSFEAIQKLAISFGTPEFKFKIITAIAVFYDTDNPVQFLKDCKALLQEDGVIVIQMNYLVSMLNDTAFDNVSHEHLGYYSVTTLNEAIEKAGLDLQGIEISRSNGGSIRAYITHKNFDNFCINDHEEKLWLNNSVSYHQVQEMRLGLETDIPYKTFSANIETKLNKIRKTLEGLKDKKVYLYGASTRGTVLTQVLFNNGDASQILGVAERDEHKYGLKMVGTWIDILPEEEFRKNADYALLLPWHFKDSIIKREAEWINKGGKFIVPLPKPMLVSAKDPEAMFATTGTTL
jgi:NDP-4-keto-2,6-dideoxyhexose 3-C-methyltransferase